MTAYDAVYLALAEALALPLITCDAKLASSAGHEAEIELVAVQDARESGLSTSQKDERRLRDFGSPGSGIVPDRLPRAIREKK